MGPLDLWRDLGEMMRARWRRSVPEMLRRILRPAVYTDIGCTTVRPLCAVLSMIRMLCHVIG